MKALISTFPNLRYIVIQRHGRQSEESDKDGLRDEGISAEGCARNTLIHLQFASFLSSKTWPSNIQILHSPVKRCAQTAQALESRLKGVFTEVPCSILGHKCLDVALYEKLGCDSMGKMKTDEWLASIMQFLDGAILKETDTLIIVAHGPHGRYLPKEFLGTYPPGNLSRLTEDDACQLNTSEMLIIEPHGKYEYIIYDDE